MKGTVNVVSEVNVGSVFTVRIPLDIKHPLLYVTALEQEAICVHEAEATSIEHSKPSLPKALIIDDNLEMIAYLKDLLSSKLDCKFAYNGVNGLALCKQEPFDLIISDYKMPQMNGFQFKAALNKLENHKETPFIMLTANTINIEEDRYLQLGISDYIVKPFKNEELFARIYHLLENSQYIKKVENISKKEFEFTGSYSELMSDVNRIIILNITNEAFTVKVLAEECGFSQQHLTLILKSKTGLTPGKIILEVRLLKSYEYLLNNTYQTLNEVIYAVGLNSRAYFNKAFLNRFGIKPGEVAK
jgi:DNA-binding response OmpR family regulator